MSLNLRRANYAPTGTTVMTANVAGTLMPGGTLVCDEIEPGTLTALFVTKAETDTITIEAAWQVSNDATTWYTFVNYNNPAVVVLGTGTAGADAAVSTAMAAPNDITGWRYCRAGVINRVAAGTVNDTYAISYYYTLRQPPSV